MPGTAPLVSVVIPTYNHARFLREALTSVVEQSLRDWEVIVVNNYSTDDTEEVVLGFDDSRISLVNFKNNGVIAASRNEGIRLARGRYVAFLDSDDLWKKEKLKSCVEKLEEGIDIVCHGAQFQWESGRTRDVTCPAGRRVNYEDLLYRGNCFLTSATMVDRRLLQEVGCFNESEEYITAEDYDLWLRIVRKTDRIAFILKVLGVYRLHGANASGSVARHLRAEIAVLADHFSRETAPGLVKRYKQQKRFALAYYSGGEKLYEGGDYFQALKYYCRTLRRNPLLLEAYINSLSAVVKLFAAKFSAK